MVLDSLKKLVFGREKELKVAGEEAGERVFVASQWQLIWWRFRKHRLAVISSVIVIFIYLIAIFAEFVAPYDPNVQNARSAYQPPSVIRFVDEDGVFHLRPFIYGIETERDLETLSLVFVEDTSIRHDIHLFVRGTPYNLWGIFPSDRHLFGLEDADARVLVFGADRTGQDMFSRVVYGARVSMSIGLVGVAMSFVLGILLGGISGYYGGTVDTIIQRAIEFIRSVPTIPLWMALSAALPPHWSPLQVYFGITIILSLIGWTTLARVVRGRFLSLRHEDFVTGARLDGARELRIIMLYLVPSFLSHIIAALTLAVPQMILSETALSFLGLGLRFPAISWGVLLREAQNVRSLAIAPWLLLPGLAVVIAVLALNFMGDGLRDAADPYA
jgi:peptide/nickel transport system permease protein